MRTRRVYLEKITENNPGEGNNPCGENNLCGGNNEAYREKLLNYIGLAKNAGALVSGVDLVVDTVRKRKAAVVLYAEDISPSSLKKLKDKTSFYNAELRELSVNMAELGRRIGLIRPAAAVCVTDKNFLAPIINLVNKLNLNIPPQGCISAEGCIDTNTEVLS